jgi:hypothetical protein
VPRIGRSEGLTTSLELSGSANVGVPPAIARDEAAVDEPAPKFDVIRVHHRADVGQPVRRDVD